MLKYSNPTRPPPPAVPRDELVSARAITKTLRRTSGCEYHGEAEIAQAVSKAGEEWHFGIEKGEVERFLAAYNLRLVEQKSAGDLEEMYFEGYPGRAAHGEAAGNRVGLITGTHCLVRAMRV